MKNKVSIIIPVYNLENYIEQCVESILEQTYTNFEAIFVNDGSTDKSSIIIERYSKLDNRIKLIHLENGGVINARFQGVENSSGEYIVFVDGDDILPLNALDILFKKFNETLDIVVSGYELISDTADPISKKVYSNENTDGEGYRNFIFSIGNQATPWGRMFRRSVLNYEAFNFDRGISLREDALMNLIISTRVRKVRIIDEITYKYRTRADSVVTKPKTIDYFIAYNKVFSDVLTKYSIPMSNKMKVYCFKIFIDILMIDFKNRNWHLDVNTSALKLIKSSNVVFDSKAKIKLTILTFYNFLFSKFNRFIGKI